MPLLLPRLRVLTVASMWLSQATNIVRAFRAVGKVQPETGIPAAVLRGAAGFAILSIAKASPWSVV